MEIVFDPAKDAANLAKHGVSLRRAVELDVLVFVDDRERFSEPRYRLYGMIDGVAYCLAAVTRDGIVRAISLRRAHKKEMRRYAAKTKI
jgi:uncharacterized protein